MTPASVDVLGNGLKEHRKSQHMSQALSLIKAALEKMEDNPGSAD